MNNKNAALLLLASIGLFAVIVMIVSNHESCLELAMKAHYPALEVRAICG